MLLYLGNMFLIWSVRRQTEYLVSVSCENLLSSIGYLILFSQSNFSVVNVLTCRINITHAGRLQILPSILVTHRKLDEGFDFSDQLNKTDDVKLFGKLFLSLLDDLLISSSFDAK